MRDEQSALALSFIIKRHNPTFTPTLANNMTTTYSWQNSFFVRLIVSFDSLRPSQNLIFRFYSEYRCGAAHHHNNRTCVTNLALPTFLMQSSFFLIWKVFPSGFGVFQDILYYLFEILFFHWIDYVRALLDSCGISNINTM